MYTCNIYDKKYKVNLYKAHYNNNDTAFYIKGKNVEEVITVCIPHSGIELTEELAFIDINNCPWAIQFLIENNLAVPLYINVGSGFVSYPLYKFDLTKVRVEENDTEI